MTRSLYLTDAYLREFDSKVSRVLYGGVLLESTAFYPGGGGQPSDKGDLNNADGRQWKVTGVEKNGDQIVHQIEGNPPSEGESVHGIIDWNLRRAHMRYHTCLHILSGVVFRRFGSVITGNQIYSDRARMDLSLSEFSPQLVSSIIDEANAVVARDYPVKVRFLSREEAMRNPTLFRVAKDLMPELDQVRLIDIEGFDIQADGGTHVSSTSQVGLVRLIRTENKGSKNKRLYVALDPVPSA